MATEIVYLGKRPKLKKPVLLTGLPGIGLVGKISLDYLIKHKKPKKIADVYSDAFPPSVHTVGGIIRSISDELYHLKLKNRDFLLLAGPVQPSLDLKIGSPQEHYEFAKAIVAEMKKLHVSEVYTLAGINVGEKRLSKKPRVIAGATTEKIMQKLVKSGAKKGDSEGLISGAAGLILGMAKREKIDGACLMGETNPSLIYGDHGAAKKLVEFLCAYFKFNVKLDELSKDSKEIEKAFKSLQKQIELDLEVEEESPKDGLSYVR